MTGEALFRKEPKCNRAQAFAVPLCHLPSLLMQPWPQQGCQAASGEVALGKLKMGPCGVCGKGCFRGQVRVMLGLCRLLSLGLGNLHVPPSNVHGQGAPIAPDAFPLPPSP